MKQELVSVVVPIYNVELYMKKCIQTIINQSYNNLEIILVDDGSTDNSGNIADEYAQKDLRVKVIHKLNGGLSDARNAGMKKATGKYICFIDSDDFIEKDMIEKMVNRITDLQVDVLIAGFYVDFEDEKGKLVDRKIKQFNTEGCYLDKNEINRELLGMFGYAWNKMYRLDYLEDNQFQFEKGLSLIEDTEFNSRVLAKAKIGLDKGIYNHYVQRNRETLGTKKYNNFLELNIRLYKCHENLLKSWRVKKEKLEEIKIMDYLLIAKGYIKGIVADDDSEILKAIEKLMSNKEIKNVILINKYKNFRDKVFCFLLKHKMILFLKLYYRK